MVQEEIANKIATLIRIGIKTLFISLHLPRDLIFVDLSEFLRRCQQEFEGMISGDTPQKRGFLCFIAHAFSLLVDSHLKRLR
jgi:hypothetical protein